ncbi:MAG: flagellar protein FlaG [Terriglobia bacterium]
MVQLVMVSSGADPSLTSPELFPTKVKSVPAEQTQNSPNAGAVSPQPKVSSDSPKRENQDLNRRIQQTIESLIGDKSELSVGFDEQTKKIIVKVINSETKEVIRQIPPEEMLKLAAALRKMKGGIFNEVV